MYTVLQWARDVYSTPYLGFRNAATMHTSDVYDQPCLYHGSNSEGSVYWPIMYSVLLGVYTYWMTRILLTIRKAQKVNAFFSSKRQTTVYKNARVAPSAAVLVRRRLQQGLMSDDVRAIFNPLIYSCIILPLLWYRAFELVFLVMNMSVFKNSITQWQDCLLAHDLSAAGTKLREAHWGQSTDETFAACGEAPPIRLFPTADNRTGVRLLQGLWFSTLFGWFACMFFIFGLSHETIKLWIK